jgi:hypothetical protein
MRATCSDTDGAFKPARSGACHVTSLRVGVRDFADLVKRGHLSAIFARLQVADRTQAILRARDAGLGHR